MKVKELIKELQKQNQELEVLTGDNERWFYNTSRVKTAKLYEGREDDESKDAELCVVICS